MVVKQAMQFLRIPKETNIQYVSSGEFVSDVPWCHAKRNLDSFVILIGINGSVFIQQGEERYELAPQSALVLLPNMTHFGYKVSETDVSYMWCHFYCQGGYEVVDECVAVDMLLKAKAHGESSDVIIPLFSHYPKMERADILFRCLLHTSNYNAFAKAESDHILSAMLYELTEQAAEISTIACETNDTETRLSELLEWVRANMDHEMTLENVARRFNYSSPYLCKMIKKKIGISFKEYLTEARLSKAKAMLVNSDKTVKEIAYEVGFEDEKYFMRIFKKTENVTPTQFRNAYNLIHMNNH